MKRGFTERKGNARSVKWLAFAIVVFLFNLNCTGRSEEAKPLLVVAKEAPPFVMVEDGKLTGFTIDLWEEIARSLGVAYTAQVLETDRVDDLLELIADKKADVGLGAITKTAEREKLYCDFSHTFFNSGLMVLARAESAHRPFLAYQVLFSSHFLKVVGSLLLSLIVVSHLLWLMERRRNHESFPRSYSLGIFESLWWSISVLVSGGCENKDPTSAPGRLVAVAWMIGGIFLTSFITANLASAMTANRLTGEVKGLADLGMRPIGVVADNAPQQTLKTMGYQTVPYRSLDAAINALQTGGVDAVVHDAPILRWQLTRRPGSKLELVGDMFALQDYGFPLTMDSPLRKQMNTELLNLKDSGFVAALHRKWLGNSPSPAAVSGF
jgi:polar amino acid transport system substrate-binding protein